MHRYTVEILQVAPSTLLSSLEAEHGGEVTLVAHFLHTAAIAAYSPQTRVGNGVFDIRSPLVSDEVRLSLELGGPAASQSALTPRLIDQRRILASSRQCVRIGAPSRAQGACWVSLYRTNAQGDLVDTAPEVGKAQLMWSVSPLHLAPSPYLSGDAAGRAMAGEGCACTPQERGCQCDVRQGVVAEHCPHCSLRRHASSTTPPAAVAGATISELTDTRRESAISAASPSFVSQDGHFDASSVSSGHPIDKLPALGPNAAEAQSSASPGIATQTSCVVESTPFSTGARVDGERAAPSGSASAEGPGGVSQPVPRFSLTEAVAPSLTVDPVAVTTARWTELDAGEASAQRTYDLTGTFEPQDETPSPSPLCADRTLRHSEPLPTGQTASSSPPPSPDAISASTPEGARAHRHTFTVGDNIVFVGSAVPGAVDAALSVDAGAGGAPEEALLSRRELNHYLLSSFPASHVTCDVVCTSAVEVLPSSSEPPCDSSCGTGPHLDYYATTTQTGIPTRRAVKNLYTRPSPIVHLAADRPEYDALRTALQDTEGYAQLYASCRPPIGHSRSRWLHNSALESIRTERLTAEESSGLPPFSVEKARDRLDVLMAFSDAERNVTHLASTPGKAASLEILKHHTMKTLMRTTVQYGTA